MSFCLRVDDLQESELSLSSLRIRQEEDSVECRPECHERSGQKNLTGSQMREGGKQAIDPRSEEYAHEGQKVRRRNDAAFLFARWAMLDERVEWNCVEPAKKSKKCQIESHRP